MMKISTFILSLFFLTQIASAGFVDRTVLYTNYSDYRIAEVELTPFPLEEFDNPGYFIEETIPVNAIVQRIDTKLNRTVANKLQLIKFMPSESNKRLTYQVRIPKDSKYEIYGTYLDKNRNFGVIRQSTTSTTSTPSSPVTVSYEINNDTSFTTNTVSEFKPYPVSASETQFIPEAVKGDYLPIFILGIGTLMLIIFYRLPHKHSIKVLTDGNVIIDKKPVGIVKELKFNVTTSHLLSVKIMGDVSRVVTSIQEKDNSFIITIEPDGKEHIGNVMFIKKNIKISKYRTKKS